MDLTATIVKVAEPILSGRGLGKSYGALRVLHEVEFDVFPGEVLGVLGPNGAGKTTLFNLVSGDTGLDEGVLTREAGRLAGIPGVLIHGHRDMSCPLAYVWELARAWPGAELRVIEDAGHLGSDATMDCLVATVDRFAAG